VKKTLAAAAVGAVIAVGWAAPAVAQTYPPPPPDDTAVLGTQFTQAPAAPAPARTSRDAAVLPFTGQEIAAAGVAGVALVGAGTALVVVGRRRRRATR
jgi:hypothetical protein